MRWNTRKLKAARKYIYIFFHYLPWANIYDCIDLKVFHCRGCFKTKKQISSLCCFFSFHLLHLSYTTKSVNKSMLSLPSFHVFCTCTKNNTCMYFNDDIFLKLSKIERNFYHWTNLLIKWSSLSLHLNLFSDLLLDLLH